MLKNPRISQSWIKLRLAKDGLFLYFSDSSDGRVVRASAYGAVDSGLITSRVKPITLKLVFTASLLDAQHQRDSVENKSGSLLVVPLRKALNGIPQP